MAMQRDFGRIQKSSGPRCLVFTEIQTGRQLNEVEVNQINFILKRRAERYIAAAKEQWLHPEDEIPSTHWRKLDDRYLLMPDPRSSAASMQQSLAAATERRSLRLSVKDEFVS